MFVYRILALCLFVLSSQAQNNTTVAVNSTQTTSASPTSAPTSLATTLPIEITSADGGNHTNFNEGELTHITWTGLDNYTDLSLGYFSNFNGTITWLISNATNHPDSYAWTVDVIARGYKLDASPQFNLVICNGPKCEDPVYGTWFAIEAQLSPGNTNPQGGAAGSQYRIHSFDLIAIVVSGSVLAMVGARLSYLLWRHGRAKVRPHWFDGLNPYGGKPKESVVSSVTEIEGDEKSQTLPTHVTTLDDIREARAQRRSRSRTGSRPGTRTSTRTKASAGGSPEPIPALPPAIHSSDNFKAIDAMV